MTELQCNFFSELQHVNLLPKSHEDIKEAAEATSRNIIHQQPMTRSGEIGVQTN